MERKALYNTLRMHLPGFPQEGQQEWQTTNFRELSIEELFNQLQRFLPTLNKKVYITYGEMFDSPEELCECFIADGAFTPQEQDNIYLLVFEIWRKILTHKPCLSIFCDELDHQIHLYDEGSENGLVIQDLITQLQTMVETAKDSGEDPSKLMQAIESQCANHLESFIYDYIAEQVDEDQIDYAQELLDSFESILTDQKWFQFLRIRVLASFDYRQADVVLRDLIEVVTNERDLEFNLQVLEFLAGWGDPQLFVGLAIETFPLVETESDLQEVLTLCGNYYSRLDFDDKEKTIVSMLKDRQCIPFDTPVDKSDDLVKGLMEYLQNS
ncbi:MAG: hypothetical protein JHC93_00790 [Parachlamydiales bacterium]|nr:hypothetical protein [Parachlamydiales bacterium]